MLPVIADDPQTRFLLLCLQSRFDPTALEMAREMASQEDINWTNLSRVIDDQLLAPLLYSTTTGRDLIPSQLAQNIREFYLQNAVRNAILLKNLAKIIDRFASAGIGLIVLKGAALAETVYKNIAVRPMADIDILVRQGHVNETLNLLGSLGYETADPETHPGSLVEYENELLLRKAGQPDLALELHWSLLDSPHYQRKLDMAWFWQTAVPAQFDGTPGQVLGPEALLLHLCSHIMLHHHGEGLLWLHDVAEVLACFNSTLHWETLLEKAQEYDLVISLQRIISLVSQDWQIELPSGILDRLNALQPSDRERQIVYWLTVAERPVAQRFWVDLATSGSWRRRTKYAWQNLFPTREYMRLRYKIEQPLLLPLYYPYRWLLGIRSLFRS
jgi:hypothetical protein